MNHVHPCGLDVRRQVVDEREEEQDRGERDRPPDDGPEDLELAAETRLVGDRAAERAAEDDEEEQAREHEPGQGDEHDRQDPHIQNGRVSTRS